MSFKEVAERRKRYGRNDIVEAAANPWLDLARDTPKDPMIWLLAITGVVLCRFGR